MTNKEINLDEITKEHFIFGSLFLIANKLQVMGDKWDEHITMKQWLLLVMIAQFREKPPTLSEVANLMGASRQNVKQLALKLETKGYLEIQKDQKDSRALRLCITKQCLDYLKGREKSEELYLKQLYEGLSEEEITSLCIGIYKLLGNIEKIEGLIEGGYRYENSDCV